MLQNAATVDEAMAQLRKVAATMTEESGRLNREITTFLNGVRAA